MIEQVLTKHSAALRRRKAYVPRRNSRFPKRFSPFGGNGLVADTNGTFGYGFTSRYRTLHCYGTAPAPYKRQGIKGAL